jgi:hypothetical protein
MEGFHPADFMPICKKSTTSKIPLVRYDKDKPHLFSAGGAHELGTCGESILLAEDIIDIHHFPVRNPTYTLGRLKQLLHRSDDGTSRIDWMDKRSKIIKGADKSQYHSRYENLKKQYIENKYLALKTPALQYDFKHISRWYSHFQGGRECVQGDMDSYISSAIYSFFMHEYDIAICRFNDALALCNLDSLKGWLLVKMAECFAFSDAETALILQKQAVNAAGEEIRNYIEKQSVEKAQDNLSIKKDSSKDTAKVESYLGVFQIDQTELLKNMDIIMEKVAACSVI